MVKNLAKNKFILIALSLVAAGLVSAAFYVKTSQPKDLGQEATQEEISANPNVGKPTEEAPSKGEITAKAPDTPATSNQSAADAPTLSVTISRAGQVDQVVQIRGLVQGAASGTCMAQLVGPGGSTVQQSRSVEHQQTGYTCGNIDIPVSQFSASGTWRLSLTVTSGSTTSKAAEQDIEVTK